MINKVRLIETPKHAFNYLSDCSRNNQVRDLRKRLEEGIEFTPGINILIGENGCGKSTVMNIIRSANRIEHSFIPTLDDRRNPQPSFNLQTLKAGLCKHNRNVKRLFG